MKNLNHKQLAWSQNMVTRATNKVRLRLAFMTLALFSLVSICMFAFGDASKEDMFKVTGISTYATIMGAVGNISDPANDYKVGKAVKAKMWLISEDQWDDTQAFPTRSGRERGNIPLKNGEYWHYISAVLDSPEIKSNAEEGEIASTITNELKFVVGGMDSSLLTLLETGIGKGFFVVWEICSTGDLYLGGNGCKPLKLSAFEGGPGKDSTSWTLTFKNQCGEIWSVYTGNTPTQAPATVAANAETITLTSNPQYQLTDGTAEVHDITGFTSVTDADINRVVTILGSGGTYPSTISESNDFLLIAGNQWEAEENTQISFKIFKDGAATYKFVEIAGTRT
jgi:hypothetical protein